MAAPAQAKTRAISLSVGLALVLTAAKAAAWAATGSVALLSETLHSGTDLIATLIAFLAVRRSVASPDASYRYGQGRAENISALFEGLVVIAAAAAIGREAVLALLHPHHLERTTLAVVVMVVAAAAYTVLGLFLRREARRLDSPALAADSQHVLVDVFSAAGVAGGLALVELTGFERLDSLVALAVAALVCYLGVKLVLPAVRVLLDASLDPAELAEIRTILQQPLPGVTGYHRLRTRRAGGHRYIDVHLTFEPELSLVRAHELASEVETKLHDRFPTIDVVIHLEPDSEAPAPGEHEGPSDRRERPAAHLGGLPGQQFERKFLLASPPDISQIVALGAEVVEIEQHYLNPRAEGEEARVRRRWQAGAESLSWTRKLTETGLGRELEEREIGRPEYDRLLADRDPSLHSIRKTRYSFLWQGVLCELDVFALPVRLQVFEVELPSPDTPFELPPFIEVAREVTGEPQFLNRTIAETLARRQALNREEWLAGLEPGDPVWVFGSSGSGEGVNYGEVASAGEQRIVVRVRGQELRFTRDGANVDSDTELTLERPGS